MTTSPTGISVLHLDSGPSFRGGQRQVLLLATGQQAEGRVVPQVLARSAVLLDRCRAAGIACSPWSNPAGIAGLWQLSRVLRRCPPQLVHAHDARAHGAACVAAPRSLQTRLVVHRRIDDVPSQRAITRWKYRHGEFVCVSKAVGDVLADWGVSRSRLHHVVSALPIPERPPQRAAPDPEEPLQLLAVGALADHKGHDVLLRALVSRPDRLFLVGTGPCERPLRRLIRRLGLSGRVEMSSDFDRLPELQRRADLFVHPSRTEGLGTAVIEAMGAGLPVLATRVGGLPELVEEGRTGWLVAPGDPARIRRALEGITVLRRQHPDELRDRGRRGWERARGDHPVGAMVQGVQQVYDGLL